MAKHMAAALEADGIITKEHLLQLSEHNEILERVLAEAVASGLPEHEVLRKHTADVTAPLPAEADDGDASGSAGSAQYHTASADCSSHDHSALKDNSGAAGSQSGQGDGSSSQQAMAAVVLTSAFKHLLGPAMRCAEDDPCGDCGLGKQQCKNVKALARALLIEATRPLPRTQDPQVLLRGVSTLITLNVFLASAVFIGLSLAAPDDIKSTLQTAYCDLTQQLVQVTANITSSSHMFARSNMTESLKWQADFQRRTSLFSCSEINRKFPEPGPEDCSGDDSKKPELMTQHITAFALFLGSTGVAFGLLLSVQPEGELNEGWERCVTWVPYICFCGFATLLGLVFLLMSLITMGEVQYGPWHHWHGCNIPWLSHLAVCFIGFEVFCALVGTAGFFNGWKVV
ncbi:hypothetical protein OEZ86_007084 [Tetradesmus obliquus]|nr:hypothetical protein OEZ86_007084 [Tetradesmus obliquus]